MRALLWLLLFPLMAIAHPGGLDAQGGHRDRQGGQYHCHRDPCLSNQVLQQQAIDEAEQENRSFSTLYDRREWPHWLDLSGNCRDARAEILIETSRISVDFHDARKCVVDRGEWIDPYSGERVFDASELDIDHLVPLKHAHGHGGHNWPTSRRRDFANDPSNLLPVKASLNRSKGSSSPDQWLPPNKDYWCEYGRRWSSVKSHYQLMVTPPEQATLEQLASHCPPSKDIVQH
ncbi:MAG: HNH endonuclease [Gammaproteobacteria bacterium HGW-Gammaproteobacteria-14]|nr:MAG: HNH endonuclease [Gammaproteobacteria bacterium HGW-Gammaproteobacteria-14]